MSKKLTTEQFIEKAKKTHGNRYNYSQSVYIDSKTKIIIICKEHGCFMQNYYAHISGQGCKQCGLVKQKKTMLEKYGVEYSAQNKEIYNKVKKTNLERYGVENPTQNKEIYNKVKKTMLDRYGVEHAAQSKEMRHRIQKTNLERYGVKLPLQKNIIDVLPLIEDKKWLFEQYIINNKTSYQIAQELNINSTTVCNYLKQHEIEIRYTTGYSLKCIQWLEEIMEQQDIFIQHAGNVGEFNIPGTRYKADGYCKENNTIYEFHGDCFHGNPDLFEEHETPNFYVKTKSAKELYESTIERENEIKKIGYNLVTIWENIYDNQKERTLY